MQPTTEAERVACRLAGWLNQLPESDEELVLECDSTMELHIVWSFREHGILGRIVHRAKDARPVPFGFELHADETGFTANALHRGSQLSVPRADRQVIIQMIGSDASTRSAGTCFKVAFWSGSARRKQL